jgi:hypothetical protein
MQNYNTIYPGDGLNLRSFAPEAVAMTTLPLQEHIIIIIFCQV